MAVKKSELYSSLWASCDELRGGMDASQYKDYVLTMLFIKYVSDNPSSIVKVPEGARFEDLVKLKGKTDIGEKMNTQVLKPLAKATGLQNLGFIVDFDDDDKLGSDQEKVDRLSNLIAIFENPALDFRNNRAEDDDILGDAYEYLMRHFATESGKSKGQFYTPAEVSRVLAKIIDVDQAHSVSQTVYDPTCGSGSLLLKVAAEADISLTLYGQEKDTATKGLAEMNMWLHGKPTADIKAGNTIASPKFRNKAGGLKRHDFVVANPPFSIKNWSNGIVPEEDEFDRFSGYGVPPDKNGDYAFLLHIVASLKSTGKGAVILPHGVLFRGNAEADIRRQLIDNKLIRGIIGLPANLFYGTGIPACIIVIDKENAHQRQGIFMIDASKGYRKDGNKNRLREQDIHLIVDVFNNRTEVDKYARFVRFDEIVDNEYNLNIPRYIDTQEAEDVQDIGAHLYGGIPERDINRLEAWWQAYPTLKRELFAPSREGYLSLAMAPDRVKPKILYHAEFLAHKEQLVGVLRDWQYGQMKLLQGINESTAPRKLIYTLGEALLQAYQDEQLIDAYTVYQHLMDYWENTMKDDVYLIAEYAAEAKADPNPEAPKGGWQARTARVIAENKKTGKKVDKGWRCDLLPKPLVIDRYFRDDQRAIYALMTEKDNLESAHQQLIEENSHEEGIFGDVEGKVSKAVLSAKLQEFEELILRTHFEHDYERWQAATQDLSLAKQALNEAVDHPDLQALADAKGKIAPVDLAAAIKEAKKNKAAEQLKACLTYEYALEGVDAALMWQREYRRTLKDDFASVVGKHDYEYVPEYATLELLLNQNEDIAKLNRRIKKLNEALDNNLYAHYPTLSQDEVQELVIEEKWWASLSKSIDAEIEAISQRLAGRIGELGTRYAHTLEALHHTSQALEAKVNNHLQNMGW